MVRYVMKIFIMHEFSSMGMNIILLLLILDPHDFIAIEQIHEFLPSDTKVCSLFEIVDDEIALEGNESFNVVITYISPQAIIGVDTSNITICDDDSKL